MIKRSENLQIIALFFMIFDQSLIIPIEIPSLGMLSVGRCLIFLILLRSLLIGIINIKSNFVKLNIAPPLRIVIIWFGFCAINLLLSPIDNENIRYIVNLLVNVICLIYSYKLAGNNLFIRYIYNFGLFTTLGFAYIDLFFKWRPPASRQWDFTNEVVGAFSNPLYLGFIIAFFIITLSIRIAFDEQKQNTKNLLMLCMTIPIVPFVGSRTLLLISTLSIVFLSILLLIRARHTYRRIPVIVASGFIMAILFSSQVFLDTLPRALVDKFSSITTLAQSSEERDKNSRFVASEIAIQLSYESPLLGYGTGAAEQKLAENSYLVSQGNVNPHNYWLELLLNYGIVGFLLFVFPIALSLVNAYKLIISGQASMRTLESAAYLVIFPFLVIGPSSINNFVFPWIMLGFSFYHANRNHASRDTADFLVDSMGEK